MSDPLGLSIGTTNLVAARVGNQPVTRRSVLPLSGQVFTGFVDRVGDPVPLIAADGSSHRADLLMVEALDAMIVEAGVDGDESPDIAVAVPAHWNGATLRALRDAMRSKPNLAPGGVPVRLVPDAVAALTALAGNPGLPDHGVVALLDFGGGGTTITLADAAASFEAIETTRLTEFSGDQIDQALLAHVLDGLAGDVDPAGTASVGSLTRLREACRQAKEELSESETADIRVELPGHQSTVHVTRDELDGLLEAPLSAVLSELDESLSRNRIAMADVSAVVAVGGGARIPLVTARLSDGERRPVVTTPHPALDAAVGAALFAAYGADSEAQTGLAPTQVPTAANVLTAANTAAPDSSTFRALAWSQDDETVGDPTPYTGEDPYADPYADFSTTRVVTQYRPRQEEERRTWQRVPLLIFGVAAVIALVAVGGVAIALTSSTEDTTPTPKTAPVTATSHVAPPPTSAQLPPPPPPTTEAPPPPVVTVTSQAPPPPPPPPPSTETVTVERPVTTTKTTTQTTTTTTTTPTTTTTIPTTTTEITPTTTTPLMTTSYITVPFVPIPIPIQVTATPTPYNPYQPYQPNSPYQPYQPPAYQQPNQFPY